MPARAGLHHFKKPLRWRGKPGELLCARRGISRSLACENKKCLRPNKETFGLSVPGVVGRELDARAFRPESLCSGESGFLRYKNRDHHRKKISMGRPRAYSHRLYGFKP